MSLPFFDCHCLFSKVGVSLYRHNTLWGKYKSRILYSCTPFQEIHFIANATYNLYQFIHSHVWMRPHTWVQYGNRTVHLISNNLLNLWNSVNTSIYVSTSTNCEIHSIPWTIVTINQKKTGTTQSTVKNS